MAEQMRPTSKKQAPDPSRSYERSRPQDETGMGELDQEADGTPADQADGAERAVTNRRNPKDLEQSP